MSATYHIARLDLEVYCAGGLDSEARRHVREHLLSCDICGRYAANLAQERSDFLRAHPFTGRTIAFPAAPRAGRQYRTVYALAASLAVALAGVTMYRTMIGGSLWRAKGDVAIRAFVKAADGSPLETTAGRVYHPGERVQLTYSCGSTNSLVLLSIDERGAITTYYPRTGDSSVVLEPGRDIPLPNSIELDDYIGRELLVAVFTEKPLALHEVRDRVAAAYAATRELSSMDLGFGERAQVRTMLLTKKRED